VRVGAEGRMNCGGGEGTKQDGFRKKRSQFSSLCVIIWQKETRKKRNG
jgi:hypothetical protein